MAYANLDQKYKPDSLTELVGQPVVQRALTELINQTDVALPHMLFTGPAGVGKTSAAIALAKELYGKEWDTNLHIFNTSDFRGINFIREKIRPLTGVSPVGAAFQIIFLDEADALTFEAQNMLRELMQEYTETTKFIFACNYPEKLTKVVQNRFAVFQFNPIPEDIIVERLQYICGKEGITYEDDSLEEIAKQAHGSLRNAIITITSSMNRHKHIELKNVHIDTIYLDELSTKKILHDALSGDVKTAEEQFLELYNKNGQRYDNVFSMILDEADKMDIDISLKREIIETTGIYDARMADPNTTKSVQIRCYLNALAMIGTNSGYVEVPEEKEEEAIYTPPKEAI